jgi:heat shock protein HslJ
MVSAGTACADGLGGTSWRLVEIVSMDDNVYAPGDRAMYTLNLQADGTAALQAGCNRGTGTWTSESAGQLRFGPIAATRAVCPPGSLSKRYLTQFQWVRSYVMKDGHLYLATLADGSIIEFEPAGIAPAAATVLGEEVHAADAAALQDAILRRLFDRYAADNGIEAAPAEVDMFVENMRRGMAAKGLDAEEDLKPEELAEANAMRRNFAREIIRQWKINKSLYERYGGRIIYQQLGPEPLDAHRAFLEQRQTEGAFTIHDSSLADGFWRYFTNESIHDFMEPGGSDEASAFTTPPWERHP